MGHNFKLYCDPTSRHLTKLRTENIIVRSKDAQWVYYSISEEFLRNENKLITFIVERFENESVYAEDLSKYHAFKENNMNCETIMIKV